MTSIIMIKHPTSNIILYSNDVDHTYTDNLDSDYIPVTTLYGKYFPEFNTEEMATECAIKRGVTKQSLIDKWKKICDDAGENGSRVHDYIHARLTNLPNLPKIDKYYKRSIENVLSAIRRKSLKLVYSEKVLFSPDLKIAGTVDCVFYDSVNNQYVSIDWKTSKTIEMFDPYHSKGFGILSHLDNCNHVHYSLQLLIYANLLKREGYLDPTIPVICRIINIHPYGGFKKSKSYDVIDLKSEVKQILRNMK